MKLKTRTIVAAGAATLLLAAGTTVAAAAVLSDPSPVSGSGVIDGCWTSAAIDGSHILVLQNQGTTCPRGTTPISWNESGPPGPPGPAGTPGANGSPGTGATVAALATGNASCPNGGASIADGSGDVAYACNGAPGPEVLAYGGVNDNGVTCSFFIGPSGANATDLTASFDTLADACVVSGFPADTLPLSIPSGASFDPSTGELTFPVVGVGAGKGSSFLFAVLEMQS